MKEEKTIIDFDKNEVPQDREVSRGKLILSNLTDDHKAMIKKGTFTLAGLAAAGSLYSMFNAGYDTSSDAKDDNRTIESNDENEIADHPQAPTEELAVIYCEACFADRVNDDMSFQEAFGTARGQVGTGGFFEWRGNVYNTYYKDEWDGMSESEQSEYWVSVTQSAEYDTLELVDNRVEITDDGIHYVDLDNDGINDVALKDIDGDGDLDTYKVDLNDDGNWDVEHGTETPVSDVANAEDTDHNPPTSESLDHDSTEQENVNENSDKPEMDEKPTKPEIGEVNPQPEEIVGPSQGIGDLNKDKIPDAFAQDTDGDGYVDVMVADLDVDGKPESYFYDTDDDEALDIIIVDYDGDGHQDEPTIEINETFTMDDFIKVDEELNVIEQDAVQPLEDIVDDADVEDWDDGDAAI